MHPLLQLLKSLKHEQSTLKGQSKFSTTIKSVKNSTTIYDKTRKNLSYKLKIAFTYILEGQVKVTVIMRQDDTKLNANAQTVKIKS